MRPVFSATWRTVADAKSVHDHLSRQTRRLDGIEPVLISASARAHTCPLSKTGNRRREPRLCRIPPRAAAGWTGPWSFSDRARSRLTGSSTQPQPRWRTMVITSSRTRTCATMLTLTSHYMATNVKHPRHAPCSPAVPARGPGAGRRGGWRCGHPVLPDHQGEGCEKYHLLPTSVPGTEHAS
jgi:hypothetical protein